MKFILGIESNTVIQFMSIDLILEFTAFNYLQNNTIKSSKAKYLLHINFYILF